MIPSTIIAGDTTNFNESFSDYPSTGWTLNAYLVGPSTLNVTGSAGTNDSFDIVFGASATQLLKAGIYDLTLRVTDGSAVYTVVRTTVDVVSNPALSQSRIVTAQRMVELIDLALINQLSDGDAIESFSIAGRNFSNISRTELIAERSKWVAELNALKRARTGQSGLKTTRIYTSNV